jgi:energy-coupling factor transporter ATP-binding protein EcfA2
MLRDLRDREGLSILMVEQNAKRALELADIGCVVVSGEIAMVGTGAELLGDPAVGACSSAVREPLNEYRAGARRANDAGQRDSRRSSCRKRAGTAKLMPEG